MSPALVLAWAVALTHLALVVWLVVGGPLAARRPALARWHLAAIVPTAVVFLAGADCPLTTWEKDLLGRAGRTPYDGGFLEHHLIEPVHPAGATPTVQLLVLAAWLLPTAVGHGWRLGAGRRIGRRPAPAPA